MVAEIPRGSTIRNTGVAHRTATEPLQIDSAVQPATNPSQIDRPARGNNWGGRAAILLASGKVVALATGQAVDSEQATGQGVADLVQTDQVVVGLARRRAGPPAVELTASAAGTSLEAEAARAGTHSEEEMADTTARERGPTAVAAPAAWALAEALGVVEVEGSVEAVVEDPAVAGGADERYLANGSRLEHQHENIICKSSSIECSLHCCGTNRLVGAGASGRSTVRHKDRRKGGSYIRCRKSQEVRYAAAGRRCAGRCCGEV